MEKQRKKQHDKERRRRANADRWPKPRYSEPRLPTPEEQMLASGTYEGWSLWDALFVE